MCLCEIALKAYMGNRGSGYLCGMGQAWGRARIFFAHKSMNSFPSNLPEVRGGTQGKGEGNTNPKLDHKVA